MDRRRFLISTGRLATSASVVGAFPGAAEAAIHLTPRQPLFSLLHSGYPPCVFGRLDGTFGAVWCNGNAAWAQHFDWRGTPFDSGHMLPLAIEFDSPVNGAAFADGRSFVTLEIGAASVYSWALSAAMTWPDSGYAFTTSLGTQSLPIFMDAISSNQVFCAWTDHGYGSRMFGAVADPSGKPGAVLDKYLGSSALKIFAVKKATEGIAAIAYCVRRPPNNTNCLCLRFFNASGMPVSKEFIVRDLHTTSYVPQMAIWADGSGGMLCAFQERSATGSSIKIIRCSQAGTIRAVTTLKLGLARTEYLSLSTTLSGRIVVAYTDVTSLSNVGRTTYAVVLNSNGSISVPRFRLGSASSGKRMMVTTFPTSSSSTAVIWLEPSQYSSSTAVMRSLGVT